MAVVSDDLAAALKMWVDASVRMDEPYVRDPVTESVARYYAAQVAKRRVQELAQAEFKQSR